LKSEDDFGGRLKEIRARKGGTGRRGKEIKKNKENREDMSLAGRTL